MSRKILWDRRRHEGRIGKGYFKESADIEEIKTQLNNGAVIHCDALWIEVDVAELDEQVLKDEGFDIAEGFTNTFGNYTRWRKNLSKTKAMLQIAAVSPKWEEMATSPQIYAYANKWGIFNIHFEPSISAQKDDYYLKSKAELEELNWANLKNYLRAINVDARYDFRSENTTRTALYADIDNGYYDEQRM